MRRRSFILFCLLVLVLIIHPPPALSKSNLVGPQMGLHQAAGPYSLALTLLPNFGTATVDVIGQIWDIPCSEIGGDLNWLSEKKVEFLLDDSASDEEGVCPFRIQSLGRLTVDPDGFYWLELPLNLGEQDKVEFVVLAADVLIERMTPEPTSSSAPLFWELKGPLEALNVPIQPWHFDTNLTLNPLLTDSLATYVRAEFFLSGQATLTGITDLRSYNAFAGRTRVPPQPKLAELLLARLDYPPLHFSDSYPGFVYLAGHKTEAAWIRETITTHRPPQLDESGEFEFTFVGSQRLISGAEPEASSLAGPSPPPAPPPESAQDGLAGVRRLSLGLVRLGPSDVLTLTIPNTSIVKTTVLPNRQPSLDTIVYEGPGEFEIEIDYAVMPGMLAQQFPIALRAFVASFESWLRTNIAQQPLPYLVVALILYILRIIGGRIFVRRLPWLDLVLWLLVGIVLLYLTPAVSSLLLLSILILTFSLNFKHPYHIWLIVLLSVIVLLDNLLIVTYPPMIGLQRQPVGVYTPLIMAIVPLSLIIGYYYWRQAVKSEAWTAESIGRLSRDYLPALSMGLLILATYEVINYSLISLSIIVMLVFFIRWRLESQQESPSVNHLSSPAEKTEGLESDDNGSTEIEQKPQASQSTLTNQGCNLLISWGKQGLTTFLWRADAEQVAISPPQEQTETETPPTGPKHPPPTWLQTLTLVLEQPLVILAIIGLALLALGFASSSLAGLAFTLLTLLSITLLFTILYETIPGRVGYVKAFLFTLPLLLIFFLGIGTLDVSLPLPNSPFVNIDLARTPSRYTLFLNDMEELLVSRLIFYLSVPLFISLYLEFQHLKQQGKVQDVRQFLNSVRSRVLLVTGILSALAPSLLSLLKEQPVIATFANLMEQFLIVTTGGS
jgi:hypothetical protein